MKERISATEMAQLVINCPSCGHTFPRPYTAKESEQLSRALFTWRSVKGTYPHLEVKPEKQGAWPLTEALSKAIRKVIGPKKIDSIDVHSRIVNVLTDHGWFDREYNNQIAALVLNALVSEEKTEPRA